MIAYRAETSSFYKVFRCPPNIVTFWVRQLISKKRAKIFCGCKDKTDFCISHYSVKDYRVMYINYAQFMVFCLCRRVADGKHGFFMWCGFVL